MAYFSFSQKSWSFLFVVTVIFASVTESTVSYSWMTIASMFLILLIIGNHPISIERFHVQQRKGISVRPGLQDMEE
jgi:hypothetical protein